MKKTGTERYWLAFGSGFMSLLMILIPLMIMDKGYMIYYGDFVSQQLPFYQLANETVRNGGLFGWNWYTDLGSSFLGSYAFYLVGSPFFWLTVILPENWVLYAIPWLLCLKHGLASLTGYAYIRRFVKKPEAAVIGGLLYAFSGFQVFNIFFNHFQDVTAFFPLMLIAMEELINHQRRGWFAASVALMAMINYFFFAGQVVFLIIYFILRCGSQDFHANGKKFIALGIEAITGVCIACVILLPAAIAVIFNNRVSEYLFGQDMILYSDKTRIIRIIQSFFMIPDPPARTNLFQSEHAKWASIGGYLPLFSMAGVIAFMQKNKKHWASRMITFCFVCALVPILNSIFYMLNAAYYARWYYMPILIMAMMTAYALDDEEIQWNKGMKICLLMLGIFGLISVLPTKEDEEVKFFEFALIPIYFCIALIISVLCWVGAKYLLNLRQKKKLFWKKAVILTVISCMACTGTIVYFGKVVGVVNMQGKTYIQEAIHGKEQLSISYENDEADYFRTDISENYDNYPMFWGLSSMKCFQSVVSPSIMDFYESIGITRDVASRADTEHYTLRGLFSVKYYFDKIPEKTKFSEEDEEETEKEELNLPGFVYDREENGFKIYRNEYYLPMGFTYDKFVTEETMKEEKDFVREKMLIHALIFNQEQKQKYQEQLEEIENISDISLTKRSYLNACAAHQEKACHDFHYDAKGFSAEITLEKPEMLFFSVPYDDGWTAEINGHSVEIENVSGGFMAILCEAGENKIIFHYQLPGLKIGIIISVTGLLLLGMYLIFGKKLVSGTPHSGEYTYRSGVQAENAYFDYLKHYAERAKEHEHSTSE